MCGEKQSHIAECHVETWEDFEQKIDEIRREIEKCKPNTQWLVTDVLYRGQADPSWRLTTTLERQTESMRLGEYLDIMENVQPYLEKISVKKWPKLDEKIGQLKRRGLEYAQKFRTVPADTREIISFMVYLRQHGFPSPLLDWTRNPYVAAFFAFQNVGKETGRVAIYTFREQTEHFGNCRSVLEPSAFAIGRDIYEASERHEAQEAQYTICLKRLSLKPCLSNYIFANHEEAVNLPGFRVTDGMDMPAARNATTKYTIPVSERTKVLRKLQEERINKCKLFGETPDNLLEDAWNTIVIDRW
jgi:hypothetical protein